MRYFTNPPEDDRDFYVHKGNKLIHSMFSNTLSHHGILGQKWGVRRFQDKNGRLTPAGRTQYNYNKIIRNAKAKGNAKTENIDTYNVGLTTFTTAGGEKYTSGLTGGHDFDWREMFNGKTASDPDLLRVDDQWISDNSPDRNISDFVVKRINPGFGSSGTTQNCAKCSSVLELVLHGYTACAGRQSFPSSSDAPEFWWKGAKQVQYDYDSCEDSLKGYGPGTSGTIGIQYGNGTGHAMHWTNDRNGNFTIEDGQNGRIFDSLSDMCSTYGADTSLGFSTYRLDNCEPNWDNMAQDSVCRIGSDKDSTRGLRNTSNPSAANVHNEWDDRWVDRW